MKLSEIGEFGLISHLQNKLEVREGTLLGIGDDCAILSALSCPIVTADALVEDVHFRRDWTSARALGRKAMAVNVSDLAASGARPVAAFVSLALSEAVDVEWVESLYEGFEDMAREFCFTVAGGDTTKSRGGVMISVTLIGEVLNEKRGPILRSGAQVGDVLMVSGTLGDSAAGFALLQTPQTLISASAREKLLLSHHEPMPRLELMRSILGFDAESLHAALDLSDGIVGDAAHLARRSSVSLQIDAEKVPISPICREAAQNLETSALDFALSGGEDYELLIAVAPIHVDDLLTRFKNEPAPLSVVGKCVAPGPAGPQVLILENGIERPQASAWRHF
ncbi:MAG TPA: thiamine-phosphate kinase [Abditibacterium sp.]